MSSAMAVVLLMCFEPIIRTSHQDKDMSKDHKYAPKVSLLKPKGFSVTIGGPKQDIPRNGPMYQEMRRKRQIDSNISDVCQGKYGIIGGSKKNMNKNKLFTPIKDITLTIKYKQVLVRGRIHTSRARGKQCFIILRQQDRTIQCFLRAVEGMVSREMVKFVSSISRESVIDVTGQVQPTASEIRSCTEKFVEIVIEEVWVVSQAETPPIQVIDCMKSEKEYESKTLGVKLKPESINVYVSLDKKLDSRVLDLRTPTNQAIFRLESGMSRAFRGSLLAKGFIEIHTPKIISAASEGGANVFSVSYFKSSAYLAQSPQLYKQMAIAADFDRVFTVGAVFRAEESDTARHLTEFVGLDFEMAFKYHYSEVLNVIEQIFIDIFKTIQKEFNHEITVIREQFESNPFVFIEPSLRLNYSEGIEMLTEAGADVVEGDDLTEKHEKLLGTLVKNKYNTDFYILDKYPLSVRPFYIMADTENSKFSNSYDVFMRGEEVMSGGQRIHDPNILRESALSHGVDLTKINAYIDAFRYGCPPHAGGGIGLERTVTLFLGLDNVRRASMFPRDPKRLIP